MGPRPSGSERDLASIFISYRRGDNAVGYAHRLGDDLGAVFGDDDVFRDAKAIPPGAPFPDYLANELRSCKAMLVVIGRDWLAETGQAGPNRLHDANDWVRQEVGEALAREILLVPCLTGGGGLPSEGA